MIDLHTHSTASDGSLSPTDLVTHANEKNISVLALTDHDTVSGLQEAESCAAKVGITFIKGIELNIEQKKGEFHLLGLGLQKISPELEHEVEILQTGRINRNLQIIDKMKADGLDVSFEEMQ